MENDPTEERVSQLTGMLHDLSKPYTEMFNTRVKQRQQKLFCQHNEAAAAEESEVKDVVDDKDDDVSLFSGFDEDNEFLQGLGGGPQCAADEAMENTPSQ